MFGIFLQQILTGFLVKSIASFDDTLTRIPLLAQLTGTNKGRIAFSVGTLLALTIILIIAIFFSFLLDLIPFRRQILAALIFLISIAVYLEIFIRSSDQKLKQKLTSLEATSHIRFVKLIGIGFIISFITLIDDAIVLVPLFIEDNMTKLFSLIGVYLAALVQIVLVVYFSSEIEKIKYKKEIASLSLVVLAVLVWWGVI